MLNESIHDEREYVNRGDAADIFVIAAGSRNSCNGQRSKVRGQRLKRYAAQKKSGMEFFIQITHAASLSCGGIPLKALDF